MYPLILHMSLLQRFNSQRCDVGLKTSWPRKEGSHSTRV